MRQVVLDCETTGTEPEEGHRILEIGCVELINRNIGNKYSQLINPQRSSDAGALKVHKLSDAYLAEQPCFFEIWDELFEFIKDSELIIHNADFDIAFLDAELRIMGHQGLVAETNCKIVDTLEIARKVYPGLSNSLDALCDRFKISRESRADRHGALIDAELLVQVYLELTGGQVAISFRESDEAYDEQISISRKGCNLQVIYADSSELEAHKTLIKEINALSDNSALWTKRE